MIRFCVTGTPRSTTRWTAEAFTTAGIPCHHEMACSRWHYDYGDDRAWQTHPSCGESSAQAAPFTKQMQAAGVPVIQLVRHPYLVVRSMVEKNLLSDPDLPITGFFAAHAPEWTGYGSPWDRALAFWIEWNRLISADIVWIPPIKATQITEFCTTYLGGGSHSTTFDLDQIPPMNRGTGTVPSVSDSTFTTALRVEALDEWERLKEGRY